ncbi:MAG TPA: hydrogenase expression/formation protein HypE [Clostridia bacterium]|nr:hydrogenase expression/formation protein HypE [Clostridia bacterium]
MTDCITMAHGSGGRDYRELVDQIFAPAFHNEFLSPLTDAAILPAGDKIAMTTDGFVVNPLFFPGGDIGRLAVCGTVNDLAVSGADARYLSCAMILETGLPLETLRRVVASMAAAAQEADVVIVTGDTKVVEPGGCAGLTITTAGVGVFPAGRMIPTQQPQAGDVILCTSPVASHGMAVMAARHNLSFDPAIESDVRPLNHIIRAVLDAGVAVRAMRDPTRGGVAGTLTEWAGTTLEITLEEESLPVRADARAACAILGIDPVYVANEGVALFSVPAEQAALALSVLRAQPGCNEAAIIGSVKEGRGAVFAKTSIGTFRRVLPPSGELLPRIC